jgi:hypothetical protein
MLALWNALHSGQIPQLGPAASVGGFHHGALYYYLLLPAVWLGRGDPAWVLLEISLAGLLVVPAVWWVGRSIGGPGAGLVAAFVAATADSLIMFSGFIWNATLVQPASALALVGVWQAWNSRRPRWWLLAAAGTAVAMQAHVAAAVLLLPVGAAWLASLKRGPSAQRRRILGWGAVSIGLVLFTYTPLIAYELSHDFAETRALIAFAIGPGSAAAHGLAARLAIGWLRCLAWPLTGWPLFRGGSTPMFQLPTSSDLVWPVIAAGILLLGLIWRATWAAIAVRRAASAGEPEGRSPVVGPAVPAVHSEMREGERAGTLLIVGSLIAMITALALLLSPVSQMSTVLVEQYHVVVDPFVVVAVGLVLGALWNARIPHAFLRMACRAMVFVALSGLLAWNALAWTSLTGPNPSWHDAQQAATRIEGDASGQPIGSVALPYTPSFETYAYPLIRDGVTMAAPAQAPIVVVMCDSSGMDGCGGPVEEAWLANQMPGTTMTLIDRFAANSARTISVYRRSAAP